MRIIKKCFQSTLAKLTITALAERTDALNDRVQGNRQGAVAGAIAGGIRKSE